MKKVINGLLYNTDTAELIAEWENGNGVSDFEYAENQLYKTARGRYFLAGHGGPASRWAVRAGNMWTGGRGIEPLDADEARSYAESHLDADEYERIFGAAEEA